MANNNPQAKYDAANTTAVKFKLNKKTDADILEYLASLDNKQGTFKRLIREEIKRSRGN
jgi:hypothetical protein